MGTTALSLLTLTATHLEGQSPELASAEAHLAEGRIAEAREALERWWPEEGSASREDRQHGLWLRARLTIDPAMAALDYRRLVVEYPGGPWSDQALLRLAWMAEQEADREGARRYLEALARDYPASPYRAEARDRLARLDAAGDPAAVGPRGPPAPPAPGSRPAEGPPDGAYTIQIGAFASLERAHALAARAGEAGLEVRVVRVEGSPLHRVRSGAFPSRDAAAASAERARRLGFDAMVTADGHREDRGR